MTNQSDSKKVSAATDDYPVVPPPSSMQVMAEGKVVLYNPDGKALVRKIGYIMGDRKEPRPVDRGQVKPPPPPAPPSKG